MDRITELDRLSDEQLSAFDIDFFNAKLWGSLTACIDRTFPSGDFSFLDVGGGNGTFADRMLKTYPLAKGTVFDSSGPLLSKNLSVTNKRTVLDDAAHLHRHPDRYDIVFFNFLLHHLV